MTHVGQGFVWTASEGRKCHPRCLCSPALSNRVKFHSPLLPIHPRSPARGEVIFTMTYSTRVLLRRLYNPQHRRIYNWLLIHLVFLFLLHPRTTSCLMLAS